MIVPPVFAAASFALCFIIAILQDPFRSSIKFVIKKRRNEAFFSVLGQAPSKQSGLLKSGSHW